MALIEKRDDQQGPRPLIPSQVLGRAPSCRLRDDNGHVSANHAEIWWDGACWFIEDLGSRNGTWVDSRRVQARQPVALTKGSLIAIGRPANVWMMLTAAPPVALAESSQGAIITAKDGVIALPDGTDPGIIVYQSNTDRWVLDGANGVEPIRSSHQVVIDGTIWTLHLPALQPQTITNMPSSPSPRSAHIELRVGHGGGAQAWMDVCEELIEVGARSSHQLLLLLSRARQHDAADALPPTQQGWLNQSQVADALKLTPNALNAAVHRLRAQFTAAGMRDASGVIERRPGTGMMRLGLTQVRIITSND